MLNGKESVIKFMQEYDTQAKCIAHFTSVRWKNGAYCAKCGSTKKIYHYKDGRHKCSDCKKVFSIKVGTIFENSNIPLRIWFVAIYMLSFDKKGVSSYQIAETLGISQKTAWFMMQRIRETSKNADISMKKLEGTVEIDATYVGGKEKNKRESKKLKEGRGTAGKLAVIRVISREDKIIAYPVREGIHTNSIESVWAVFKRGIIGVYHYVSRKHLNRYVHEFVNRINNRNLSNRGQVHGTLSR